MMQILTELPKGFQTAFLLQFVGSLEKQVSRFTGGAVYGIRNIRFEEPTVLSNEDMLLWRYPFYDRWDQHADEDEITIVFKFSPEWLALRDHPITNWRGAIGTISYECTCQHQRRGVPCVHYLGAAKNLVQKLGNASGEAIIEWMQKHFQTSTSLGDAILLDLERANEPQKAESESRILWRLTNYSGYYRAVIKVTACLQRRKKRLEAGWTVGREIHNMSESLPASACQHPSDELLAALVNALQSTDYSNGMLLLQLLRLLKDHPAVVWESDTPIKVVEASPAIQVIEEQGVFKTEICIGGQRIDDFNSMLACNRDMKLGYHRAGDQLLFYQIPSAVIENMKRVQRSSTRGARFTPEAALRISSLVSKAYTEKTLPTILPESLAGPEVPLPPTIQLHLVPRTPEGLVASLRVACDAVLEHPIPGIEPDRLRVDTPAGPVQYLRDLAAEADCANAYVQSLELAKCAYDGPYTWIAESIPTALQLIERAAEQASNGLVVCWPKSQPMRLMGEITPQSLRVRVETHRDWFGMEGELAIDGMQIPLAELLAALRRGGSYVQLASGQFASISDQLRKRLTVIDDVSSTEGKQIRVARAGGTLLQESLSDDINLESDTKWLEAVERLTNTKKLPKKPPKGLNAQLRDYQITGYQWLAKLSHWGLGGCLADDMGLGKTVQTLGVLLDRASLGPALVVAPTSVGVNWVRETERFASSLDAKLYREHNRDDLIRDATAGDLIIVSYQLLQRDAARFASRSWATLILDESQFIKNFHTKTSQAIRELQADWRLAISGTPLENHLGELWGLMRVVSPGLLGSWERFRKRFAEPIERDKDHERLEGLSRVVRPFILRRTKSEVLKELPPRTEVVLSVELSAAERKKYDAARVAALTDLTAPKEGDNDQTKRIRVLSWLMRLRQLACHVRLVDSSWKKSSAKLDQFLETIRELRENGHRALVFSQFVQHLAIIREALDKEGVKYQYLDGSTKTSKRQEAIDAFQNGEGDLFLISLKAGGTGLNLTAADYVLHLDPWWNPATEDQATDRAHRIGQTRSVTVYRFVTRDTIEEQILSLHDSKRQLMTGLLEGTDSAGKMSTEELVELIRSNQLEAVL
jgi:superfamily II DNA or RNA helicase